MKRRYVLLLILIISTLLYANSFHNSFQYDDQYDIEENVHLKTAGLTDIFLHPSYYLSTQDTSTGHYRPLVFLTYVVNYRLHGLNPVGYHIGNLLFHAGSAFMIFLIVEELFGSSGFFIALSSSLIFVVHPFNAETVNYITARSSGMSGFFYLLAFYLWVRFRSQKLEVRSKTKSNISPYFYIASLIAFLLGMLTKEVVVTLPAVLLLYDLYFIPVRGKDFYEWMIRRIRLSLPIALFPLMVVIPYLAIRVFTWGHVLSPFKRTLTVQLYTELPALVKYLRLFILPIGYNVDHYSNVYKTLFAWPVIASAIILILIIAMAIASYKSKAKEWRVVSFFAVWFFVVLLPTTLIPLNAILQENRGYLAIIPFTVFSGVVLNKLSFRAKDGTAPRPLSLPGLVPLFLLFMLLLLYGSGTVYRNSVWKDGISLWSDAVKKSPGSSRAYVNLGTSYARSGKNDQAIMSFLTALRLANPDTGGNPADIHYNIGTVYQQMGALDMAIEEYKIVSDQSPSDFRPYYNLGVIYQQKGAKEAAAEAYKKVLDRNPSDFRSYHNLGLIYQTGGRIDLAEEFYKKAISLNPDYSRSRFNLGVIYEMKGRLDLAKEEYMATLRQNPDYKSAYYNLGQLYERKGDLEMAMQVYEEAARRNPGDQELYAHINSLKEQYKRQ